MSTIVIAIPVVLIIATIVFVISRANTGNEEKQTGSKLVGDAVAKIEEGRGDLQKGKDRLDEENQGDNDYLDQRRRALAEEERRVGEDIQERERLKAEADRLLGQAPVNQDKNSDEEV